MDKKVTYAAIAVIVIVLIAAIAVVAVSGNDDNDNNDTADDVTFLIQDEDGVYFWAFGEGATVIDAFKDAVKDYEMPFTPSKDENGKDYGISSLFGLEMKQVGADWFWWSQYTWTDDAWVSSNLMMSEYTPEDAGHYVACVYGDGKTDVSKLATPKDAVVWDKNTSGVTFTVQNGENLWFKANGEGATVLDAFKNMTSTYKIPFEVSVYQGSENGIQSLFGMTTSQLDDGTWVWWEQFNYDGSNWISCSDYMNEMTSGDNPVFKLVYGAGAMM